MYSTCLFCSGALGRNEAIEHFPVGRRLAFDAAKGRLWVVCQSCARWNLTPLESRWEAIEEAERAYRDTKLRASTPNVGLAKLKDGTELVRIGSPLLPEFAAWRYGDVFKRRRRRSQVLGAAALVIPGSLFVGHIFGVTAALGIGSFSSAFATLYNVGAPLVRSHSQRRVRGVFTDTDGTRYPISAADAMKSQIIYDESSSHWDVQLEYRGTVPAGPIRRAFGKHYQHDSEGWVIRLRDMSARHALSVLLPILNAQGASAKRVSEAVELASGADGSNELFMQRQGKQSTRLLGEGRSILMGLPGETRLAMEIMLHEADERRAMQGELAELEARWKEAEQIAAIADNMFLPLSVADRVDGLKREAAESGE